MPASADGSADRAGKTEKIVVPPRATGKKTGYDLGLCGVARIVPRGPDRTEQSTMSNTNDPKPGQPNDPKKPEKKPDAYASSFDFALPEGADSFSDLAPPAPPSTSDPEMGTAAPLPPRPEAPRSGSKNSFEFTLSDAEFELPPDSGTKLNKPPRASDPAPPPAKSDSGINLGALPKPPVEVSGPPAVAKPPSSATLKLPPVAQPPSSPMFELPQQPAALPVPTEFDLPPIAEPNVFAVPSDPVVDLPPSTTPVAQPPSAPTFELPPVAVPVPTAFDIPPFAEPPSTPTLELPPLAQLPTAPTFELPEVPTAQPLTREFELPPVSDASELTLAEPGADAFDLPPAEEVTLVQPASDVFDLPALDEVTLAEPASDVFKLPPVPEVKPVQPPSDVFTLPPVPDVKQPSSTFELPPVPKAPSEPVVSVPPVPKPPSVPDLDTVLGAPDAPAAPAAFSTIPTPLSAIGLKPLSSQDLGEVVPADAHEVPVGELPDAELAQPLSGLDLAEELEPVDTPAVPTKPPAKPPVYQSAFDFALPEGADSFSDLAAPALPSTSDPEMGTAAPLPPRPEAHHGSKNSFEFTLSDPNMQLPPEPAAPARPPRASDPAPVPAVPTPSTGSVPDIAARFPAPPVPKDPADVFGDMSGVKPVQPVSDWLDSDVIPAKAVPSVPAAPAAPVDAANTSDIFGTGAVPKAGAVGASDVLAATGGRGSSVVDYKAPEAEAGASDGESIHDMELPEDLLPTATVDEPDYAARPDGGADASSILSELSDAPPRQPGDSSGIRLESPGLSRTLEGGSGEQFDITMLDQPVPADLEAAAPGNSDDATSWDQQSGSDLFAERRTAPPVDADEGRVNPVDPNLPAEDPSLTSDEQSIFSGMPRGEGSGTSVGSSSVRIGAPSDPNVTAERNPARPPAVPRRTGPAPVKPGDRGSIGFDFTADEDNANVSRAASPSELMDALKDDSAESQTRAKPAPAGSDGSGPSASVDWLAGSNEGEALPDELTTDPEFGNKLEKRRAEKAKPAPAKPAAKRGPKTDTAEVAPAPKPRRTERADADPAGDSYANQKPSSRSLLVGALLGGLLSGGAFAVAYFGGLIPNADPVAKNGGGKSNTGTDTGNGKGNGKQVEPPALDARAALLAGDAKGALAQIDKNAPKTAAEKATAGQVRLFARLQELGTETAKGDDADLLKARAHLEEVVKDAAPDKESQKRAVTAAVQLGVSYEVACDTKKAREVFEANRDKFPDHKQVFEALIDRLDAAEKPAAAPLSRLNAPDAQRLLLALTVALVQDVPKGDEPAESGTAFWKAVNRAAGGKYAEAQKLIAEAKALHEKRARALAGRGLNPLTDPLEQMFPKACDELATYWALRDKLYGNAAIAAAIKKDGLDKTLTGFAKAATELEKAKIDLADAQLLLTKALQDVTETKKLLTAAKTETEEAKKAAKKFEMDADDAKKLALKYDADAKKFEKEAAEATKAATKFETEAGEVKKLATKLETEAGEAKRAATEAKAALAKAEEAAKGSAAQLAALAKELGAPEKASAADLLAAAKGAMARATGPDLSKLIPKDWKGGTLTAEQLNQLGKDLAEAQKEAKTVAKKFEGEVNTLKTAHAKELEAQKADAALAVKLEKEAAAKALKDQATKYDDAAKIAATKAAENVEAEKLKAAAAQKALVDQKIAFDKQLANAVTPSSTMDLWLPVLTDLRRASDAPAARAAAEKALAAAAQNSEDEAKAQTVSGMARLNAGDFAGAKEQFRAAKGSPAFEPNAEKAWAKAVVLGLEAVDDPLALYRQKVEVPATDARLEARALDAGVTAYRAARYEDAVRELSEAVKNAPADPVSLYYLGAAKWARGDADAARKDFAQGAEREKVSPVPSRVVSSALSPVQGAVRDAIDSARP